MDRVNDQRLPLVLLETPDLRVQIISSEIVFRADGSFRQIDRYEELAAGVSSIRADTISGNWTLADSEVVLSIPAGAIILTVRGTWNGSRDLVFDWEGLAYAYERDG